MVKEKLLHARISNPLFLRKTILESAIMSAEMAKSAVDLKAIKTQKNKHKMQLNKLFSEIKILRNRLEEHELPSLSLVQSEKPKGLKGVKKDEKVEKLKRKKQEIILKKEKDSAHLILDSEINQLKERIRNL